MTSRKMAVKGLFAALALAMVWALGAAPAMAQTGNAESGEKIYQKRCVWCHGVEGDGDGPAGELLLPSPRDFTEGIYKFQTSPFPEDFPKDADIFRAITQGMPGTDMPGWKDMLSSQDRWDLVAYLKAFAELEEEPTANVDYGTQVETSPESIVRGKALFLDGDRCTECHGRDGKGNAIKKLKTDNGERTWPRNLTKPWLFRAGTSSKDIFTRISTGLSGTQMPSFADPRSKKKLSVEERWDVANYVVSLAKTRKIVDAGNTVVKATRLEGALPADPLDAKWDDAQTTTYMLIPQIISKERVFTYTNDTITVSAFYNDKELALLLEWDDRTKSLPGDDSDKIADAQPYQDSVAVQFPVRMPDGVVKPYFLMGDSANPVTIWQWRSGTKDAGQSVAVANAKGQDKVEKRDPAKVGLSAKGTYKDGTWRVVVRRALASPNPETDLTFEQGRFIPIAFANWDGSASETGTKHTLTTWYWLLLKPADSLKPAISAIAVAGLILAFLVWWARSAKGRREEEAGS